MQSAGPDGRGQLERKARWDFECVALGGSCLKRTGSDWSTRLASSTEHPSSARTVRLQDRAEEGTERRATDGRRYREARLRWWPSRERAWARAWPPSPPEERVQTKKRNIHNLGVVYRANLKQQSSRLHVFIFKLCERHQAGETLLSTPGSRTPARDPTAVRNTASSSRMALALGPGEEYYSVKTDTSGLAF